MFERHSIETRVTRIAALESAQWRRPVPPSVRLNISRHLKKYSQIEQDNPNLIWLYSLMLQNEIDIPHGEIVSGMKQRILREKGITELSWRYIANGKSDDFRVVLDSLDPGNTKKWQWKILIYWLQILTCLKRQTPIPEQIQHLFLNDSLILLPGQNIVDFRGAWLKIETLNQVLNEAEHRLNAGTLEQFVETDLVEVATWLSSTEISLDKNQIKRGWTYLFKSAIEWKEDKQAMETYKHLKWDSCLSMMQFGNWILEPVVDAWSLQKLALSQRHCGHRYIEDCINGKERIFVFRNFADKIVATMRLTVRRHNWSVGDLKGFANTVVSSELSELGRTIAQLYSDKYFGR